MIIPKCPLPTAPGTYICWRSYNSIPDIIQVEKCNGELLYRHDGSVFKLDSLPNHVKASMLFWGPITLE